MSSVTINVVRIPTQSSKGHESLWHLGPSLRASGSITFTRSSESSRTVTYSGSASSTLASSSATYPYPVKCYILYRDDNESDWKEKDFGSIPSGGGSTGTKTGSINIGRGQIRICFYCGQTGGCQVGYPGYQDVGSYNGSNSGSINVGESNEPLPYNPYEKPQLTFSNPVPGYNSDGNLNYLNANKEFKVTYNKSDGLKTPSSSSWKLTIGDEDNNYNSSNKVKDGTLSNDGGTLSFVDLYKESFYKSNRDGKKVRIYGERVGRGNTGTVSSSQSLGRIRWRPIRKLSGTLLTEGITLSGTNIKASIGKYDENYYGLINKVKVILSYDNTSTSKYVDYPVNEISITDLFSTVIEPIKTYKVSILPVYYMSSKNILEGTIVNDLGSFSLVSKLWDTTVSLPITENDCSWVGSRLYIKFALPIDPDVNSLGGISGYTYGDIIVNITDTSGNSKSYSFSKNKEMFSCNKLTYRRNVVFSNKISSINENTIPFKPGNITVSITVQKSLRPSTSPERVDSSTSISVNLISIPTYNPVVGEKILYSDFTNLCKTIFRMGKSYRVTKTLTDNITQDNISTKTDPVIIKQIHYNELYGILEDICANINSGVEYENTSIKPSISGLVNNKGEEITASLSHNNIKIGYNWIKLLINSGDYISRLPYNS